MSAFLYGTALQWKLDFRKQDVIISFYLIPLVMFAVMGGVLTSIMPDMQDTVIQSMTIFGVSMGAFNGLPSSLVQIYGSDIKNVYKANGVPLSMGVITHFISAFIHLFIMSMIIFFVAPLLFDAALPANLPLYFGSLALFIAASISIGSTLGVWIKDHAKVSMIAQLFFLPSVMLSGIMMPAEVLPNVFSTIGRAVPATWGKLLMSSDVFNLGYFLPLIGMFAVAALACAVALSRKVKA